MGLLVVCVFLALCCAALLWDRRRLQRRAHRAGGNVARAESIADELESNRRFLNAILDSIGDPIFVKDSAHRYIYVNEAKCQLTGHKRDAIIGKTDYDFTPPEKEQVDVFVRQDNIVLETGEEDINEEALTGSDGILRTVLTKKSLYIDDAGRRCVVGIIRDITEHKRAEEALKRSQATYLAEAQRLSDTGSFGWDAVSGEMFWSDESFRIFGYEPGMKPSIEAIIHRVHPEDVALVEGMIERGEKGQQDFDFEHRLMMPDGSVKYLHVVAHAVRDEPGKLRFMGAVMDITARKKTDEALRVSEQRYRHLFHYMPVAILQLSARG